MKSVDALITSGTKGVKKFNVNGKKEYKQYLDFGGKLIIEYVINATLKAKRVKNLYITGDYKKLNILINKKYRNYKKRIFIIEHQRDLMSSVSFAFKKIKGKVILLPSDAPFINSKEIDKFIELANPKMNYIIGFTSKKAVEKMFKAMKINHVAEKFKFSFFPAYNVDVRINNLHILDFHNIDTSAIKLGQDIFDHRYLMKRSGKVRLGNWLGMGKALIIYFLRNIDKFHYISLGVLRALFQGLMITFAIKFKNFKIFRRLNTRESIIKTFNYLSAKRVKCDILLTDLVSPLLDIDIEENYDLFLDKRDKLKRYT